MKFIGVCWERDNEEETIQAATVPMNGTAALEWLASRPSDDLGYAVWTLGQATRTFDEV